jgi:hypothetical protein
VITLKERKWIDSTNAKVLKEQQNGLNDSEIDAQETSEDHRTADDLMRIL